MTWDPDAGSGYGAPVPLSSACTVTLTTPLDVFAAVKLSVPPAEIVGPELNISGLLTLRMVKPGPRFDPTGDH